jgi:hypothetical protein
MSASVCASLGSAGKFALPNVAVYGHCGALNRGAIVCTANTIHWDIGGLSVRTIYGFDLSRLAIPWSFAAGSSS